MLFFNLAQIIEDLTSNQKVLGSNPSWCLSLYSLTMHTYSFKITLIMYSYYHSNNENTAMIILQLCWCCHSNKVHYKKFKIHNKLYIILLLWFLDSYWTGIELSSLIDMLFIKYWLLYSFTLKSMGWHKLDNSSTSTLSIYLSTFVFISIYNYTCT